MPFTGNYIQGSAITQANANTGGFIPTIWEKELLIERDTKLVMVNGITARSFVGKHGDVFRHPGISKSFGISNKLPETAVTFNTAVEESWEIRADRYRYMAMAIEDITEIKADYDLRGPYTQKIAYQMARDVDNHILGLRADLQGYESGSQVIYNTSNGLVGGTPETLDLAAIMAGKQLLEEADVPDENLCMFVSPSQYNALVLLDEFRSSDYVEGRPQATGLVGSVFGIQIYKTNQIRPNTATGYVEFVGDTPVPTPGFTAQTGANKGNDSEFFPTQLYTDLATAASLPVNFQSALLCNKEWAQMVLQKNVSMEQGRLFSYLADGLISTQLFGVKMYRPDHAVLIHTA